MCKGTGFLRWSHNYCRPFSRAKLSVISCLPSFRRSNRPRKAYFRATMEPTPHSTQVYNHVNYTELKDYKYPECMGKAHDGIVRALIFVEEHTLLISASGDRSISIHDDSKVIKNGASHTTPSASPV